MKSWSMKFILDHCIERWEKGQSQMGENRLKHCFSGKCRVGNWSSWSWAEASEVYSNPKVYKRGREAPQEKKESLIQ